MFKKYGDGKIVSVIDDDQLTEEQKKTSKQLSEKIKKSIKKENKESSSKKGDN